MSDLKVTNKLSTADKQSFYESVIDNNLELFISYLNGNEYRPPFDIFEEVSKFGYNWTVLHYAMHYGKWDIINYIFKYLQKKNLLDKALKMKTNDNRCPILCLLKSNNLSANQKKKIYFKIINTFNISISDEVVEDAIKRNFYNNDNDNNKYNNKYDNDNNQNNSLLKNELNVEQKMEFYNSAVNGDLELFKSFIYGTADRKPYHIFEEVSAPGYNWTVLHYAMHYGKLEIIKFILQYLKQKELFDFALNLKTKENKCPLLCLLKSNDLSNKEKRDVFSKITDLFQIPISKEVQDELFRREMEDLLFK